jgi:hypothetical protein
LNWQTCAKLFTLLALLCSIFPPTTRAKQEDLPSYILPEHRLILQKWLQQRPYLRPATEQDTDSPEALKLVREGYTGKPFQAFYAVADFNHDGQKDFAIGFVNRKRPKDMALAVFNGPFGKRRASVPAFYHETRFGLSDFLILVGDRWDQLQIGTGSDAHTVLLKPKRGGYYIWEGATQ